MKREVNPRASYKKNTMQFIAGLSHTVGYRKMTNSILDYLTVADL